MDPHKRYEDFEQPTPIAIAASAVGMVAISVFGAPGAREYAENSAWHCSSPTSCATSVKMPARLRIYLPLADLRRFGVSEDDVLAGRTTRLHRDPATTSKPVARIASTIAHLALPKNQNARRRRS